MTPKQKKLLIWSVAGVSVVGLLTGGVIVGKKYIWPKYKDRQIQEINEEARAYLAKGDAMNAMVLARKSLQKNQQNVESWRIGAAAAKARQLPEALFYQNQLTKYEGTKENHIELLRLAIQNEQYGFAINAIKNAGAIPANDPIFHKYAAAIYKAVGRPLASKHHLQMLETLTPNDIEAQIELASIEMAEDKTGKNQKLRIKLRALAENPLVKSRALSLLLSESVREKRKVESLELLERIQVAGPLDLSQKLIVANAIRLCKPQQLADQIQKIQNEHASLESDVVAVVDFLTKAGETPAIFEWYPKLAENIRNSEDVKRAVADAYFARKDWKLLQSHLQTGKWGKKEYLRHAMLAYAYRAQGKVSDYFENWKIAVMESGLNVRSSMDLLARADSWRWETERFDVVWKLFNLIPENEQIRQQLFDYEYKNKNTANINRLFARMLEVDEHDTVSMNNYAYTSFLLDANLARASLLAEQLYKSDPQSPYFTSSQAFSLSKQGKAKEALALLESLRPAALAEPERMALHSYLLAKAGETNKAAELIGGIVRGKLMPEENGLIEYAEQEIAKQSRTREYTSRMLAISQGKDNSTAALGWLANMRPETRAGATSAMQLADSLYSVGDVKGMNEILRDDDWQDLNYLRLALLAYCERQQGNTSKARDRWSSAFSAVKRNQVGMENLKALASKWNWSQERIDTINALFELNPGNRMMLAELLNHYRGIKRVNEMVRLLNLHQTDKSPGPDETTLLNYYNLLRGSETANATVKAKGLFESEPDNADFRYVFVLALLKQGRNDEANKLLADAKAVRMDEISTQLIHAYAAVNTGKIQEAESLIADILTEKLMGDELDLLDKLRERIRKLKQPATQP